MVQDNICITEGEDDSILIDLSVSGVPYTIRRSLLTEKNWILSRIVESEIPWAIRHKGRYFLDVDAESFRSGFFILHDMSRCRLPLWAPL